MSPRRVADDESSAAAGPGPVADARAALAARAAARRAARIAAQEEQIRTLLRMTGAILAATLAVFLLSDGAADVAGLVGGGGWAPRSGRVPDTRLELAVTLPQLHACALVNVTYERTEVCPSCAGRGGHGRATCGVCGGAGGVVQHVRTPFGVQAVRARCDACGGAGVVVAHRCAACGGAGARRGVRATRAVRLSPGLQGGDVVRLPRAGDEAPGGDAGDVLVALEEATGDAFDVEGFEPGVAQLAFRRRAGAGAGGSAPGGGDAERASLDVTADLAVDLPEALAGFSRRVRSLGGGELRVARAGVTQPGEEIVVPGGGLRGRPPRGALPARVGALEDGRRVLVEQQRPGVDTPLVAPPPGESQTEGGEGHGARHARGGGLLARARAIARAALLGRRDDAADGSGGGCAGGPAGDLYVRVAVNFPRELTDEARAALDEALPR